MSIYDLLYLMLILWRCLELALARLVCAILGLQTALVSALLHQLLAAVPIQLGLMRLLGGPVER